MTQSTATAQGTSMTQGTPMTQSTASTGSPPNEQDASTGPHGDGGGTAEDGGGAVGDGGGGAAEDVASLGYEAARDELVDVVRRLEAGGEPLEASLALWERGEALAARCQRWLDGARARLDASTSQDAGGDEVPGR